MATMLHVLETVDAMVARLEPLPKDPLPIDEGKLMAAMGRARRVRDALEERDALVAAALQAALAGPEPLAAVAAVIARLDRQG